ncbi:EVE domain-containing protein [Catenovulum maritimum]|uniref:EVE domain-containing protein n=1 Tax=Catenovulum maritimum TaxID=1513271 RepID=A0A0J8GRE5_9ALTE|nr:EVE domain-containing protein [Catenovulum maritimum]KMT65272.1 hypothetical protein XM47_09555 [Catenovulum maritimum]
MKYWLLKTEPDECSIDDIKNSPEQTMVWDGVRNYQARNNIRDHIQLGDLAFIYHSSCQAVGIVGVVEVVKASYPDPEQFNTSSTLYDLKSSPENPRWFNIDIKFKTKFNRIVSLKQIKSIDVLSDMALIKQARLSVQPVTAEHWQFIHSINNV